MNADIYQQYLQGTASQSGDERCEHRVKVLKRGMLAFNNQFEGQTCVVRDMTSGGAKLELQNIVALPKFFTLHIEIDGIQVDCHLIWQKPPFAGVEFIGEARASNLARQQSIGTSESTLSETFMREFQMRQAHEHRGQENIETNTHRNRPRAKAKPFGKRAFKG